MKKQLLLVVAFIFAMGQTFAQGTQEQTPQKPTITVCYRDAGLGEQETMYKWIKSAYDKWDKKDQVNLDIAPITASEGDYFTKIALQLADSKTCPDLVDEDTFQLPNDVEAGYLSNLDDLVKTYDDWQNGKYYGTMKQVVTYKGSVYGIPYCTDTRGLWYDRQILQDAGVIKAGEEWQPASWADVFSACEKVKANRPDVVPFWCNVGVATGEATSMQTYEMLLYGTGERLLDQNGKWIVSSKGMRDTLQFLQDVYVNKGYGPSLDLVLNGQAANTAFRQYFPAHKLAIALDGCWKCGNWKATGPAPVADYEHTFGFAKMPTQTGNNGGSITLSGGNAFSIPENADQKQWAFEFLKQLMDPEGGYLDSIIAQGNICTRTDILDVPQYANQPYFRLATKLLETAAFRPQNDQYPSVSTCIQTMVESVVSGTSIQDAIDQYGKDVTRIVGASNVVSLT